MMEARKKRIEPPHKENTDDDEMEEMVLRVLDESPGPTPHGRTEKGGTGT